MLKQVEKFDARVAKPHPDPSVRDLPAAALAKLYVGGNPAAAEALLRHMFQLQNMDANSPGYGMVPWQENHPEIKDGNSVDFTMMPFAQIIRRFGSRLSPEFKREALPHLQAAIAGVRSRNAGVAYTNIYLMQVTSLLLLGEAVGDESAIADARQQFDEWIDLTRKEGITEYDSPTYTPVQMGCLQIAYDNTAQEDLKPRIKACLDYFWSDIAANYYAPRESLSGPESRVYNFLFGDENINQFYYLAGLRHEIPGETLLSDDVRIWSNAATPGGYRPSEAILALARLPERTIFQRYGTEPGKDRYNYITPDYALGTASSFYGSQDKQISLEFGTAKKLPYIEVAADVFDAPYGKIKTGDKSGHQKPKHLKDNIAAVQDKGTVLALLDVSPDVAGKTPESVATNVLFPVHADAVYLNEKKLPADQPYDEPADAGSVVIVREGQAAAALRLFAADGTEGKPAQFAVKYDGNEWGAGRLVAYHAKGGKEALPHEPIHAGVYLHVERCADDAAFQDFMRRALACRIDQRHDGAQWSASVQTGDTRLEAALDGEQHIAYRRVGGHEVESHRLTVNGRDFASELLDPLATSPASAVSPAAR